MEIHLDKLATELEGPNNVIARLIVDLRRRRIQPSQAFTLAAQAIEDIAKALRRFGESINGQEVPVGNLSRRSATNIPILIHDAATKKNAI